MKKGAQPSDRVMRFLDAAGMMKRPKRNNPEKAIPRKERKAKDEEATKAKEAGDAAAKTARRQPIKPPRTRPPKNRPKRRRRAEARRLATVADRICVARIGAAHGVRGEVKLWPFTQVPMAVASYGPLETQDGARRFEIEALRPARIIWSRASPALAIATRRRSCAISTYLCRARGCRRSRKPILFIMPI